MKKIDYIDNILVGVTTILFAPTALGDVVYIAIPLILLGLTLIAMATREYYERDNNLQRR